MWSDMPGLLEAILRERPSLRQGMESLLDYCQEAAPAHKSVWDSLRAIDFEADADRLSAWVNDVFASEPPAAEINGLWFGLYNPCRDPELEGLPEETSQLYVAGSSSYDANDFWNGWLYQLEYRPTSGYANSRVIPAIYDGVAATGDDNCFPLGEPILCHGYIALVLSTWIDGPMKLALLGNAPLRGIAFGHDGGDPYHAGDITA